MWVAPVEQCADWIDWFRLAYRVSTDEHPTSISLFSCHLLLSPSSRLLIKRLQSTLPLPFHFRFINALLIYKTMCIFVRKRELKGYTIGSPFSNKNVYGFINIYIFTELYFDINKNSKCLINNALLLRWLPCQRFTFSHLLESSLIFYHSRIQWKALIISHTLELIWISRSFGKSAISPLSPPLNPSPPFPYPSSFPSNYILPSTNMYTAHSILAFAQVERNTIVLISTLIVNQTVRN